MAFSPSAQDMSEAQDMVLKISVRKLLDYQVIDVAELVYEGFDPKRIMAIFIHKGKTAKREGMAELMGKEVAKNSIEYIMAEAGSLATLAIMRGSKIKKIMDKTGDKAAKWIKECIEVYGIKQMDRKRAPGKDDITLLRMGAIFAHLVVLQVDTGVFEPAVTPTHFNFPVEVPRAVCCSVFGSMIPKEGTIEGLPDDDRRMLVKAWCYHQYAFDKVINPDKPSGKDKIASFAGIQIGNSFHDARLRQRILRACGLLDDSNKIPDPKRVALRQMATAWEDLPASQTG
uniref:Nucleoprotein n=1 Tax=Reticulitermes chinensis phenuivirus 1 TaxID=3133476 RepID=A0AAT9JF06_9VIRU